MVGILSFIYIYLLSSVLRVYPWRVFFQYDLLVAWIIHLPPGSKHQIDAQKQSVTEIHEAAPVYVF